MAYIPHFTLVHIPKPSWRKLALPFLMSSMPYIFETHLHSEFESHLVCNYYKQLLALKNYYYKYHRINSVLIPSDLIIRRPMYMCSCSESTKKRDIDLSSLTVGNCFTMVYYMETRNTYLYLNCKRKLTQTLVIHCIPFSVTRKGQRNTIDHYIPH